MSKTIQKFCILSSLSVMKSVYLSKVAMSLWLQEYYLYLSRKCAKMDKEMRTRK